METIGDAMRWIGNFRVENLAEDFGVLADTIEVIGAVALMFGGIGITYLIQKWADKSGDEAAAANVGRGGGLETYQDNSIRR